MHNFAHMLCLTKTFRRIIIINAIAKNCTYKFFAIFVGVMDTRRNVASGNQSGTQG